LLSVRLLLAEILVRSLLSSLTFALHHTVDRRPSTVDRRRH
jgi:hypothetical protein